MMQVLLVLARAYGLTGYDASYLELAVRKGLPLGTADGRLLEAARKAGVEKKTPIPRGSLTR